MQHIHIYISGRLDYTYKARPHYPHVIDHHLPSYDNYLTTVNPAHLVTLPLRSIAFQDAVDSRGHLCLYFARLFLSLPIDHLAQSHITHSVSTNCTLSLSITHSQTCSPTSLSALSPSSPVSLVLSQQLILPRSRSSRLNLKHRD